MQNRESNNKTLNLIKECWETSEKNVRHLIAERYHVHDEVFITRLLFGELFAEFETRNNKHDFEKAFLSDLEKTFTSNSYRSERIRLSKGIVAKVSYHEPHIEKRTGGDLGLVIARPIVTPISTDRLRYKVAQQGLLTQAKRENEKKKFGSFTKKQQLLLPQHLSYAAILLYTYTVREEYQLAPFLWFVCKGDTFEDVKNILADYNWCMEEVKTSSIIFEKLWTFQIGTNDDKVIKNHICPEDAPHILIEITWRDGAPDPSPPPPPPSKGRGLTFTRSVKTISKPQTSFRRPAQKTPLVKRKNG